MRGGSAGRSFLKPFFRIWGNFFQSFRTKFLSSVHLIIIMGLEISHCLSANHNPGLRCVIWTGLTLFALLLHWTALSQSESCILLSGLHFLYDMNFVHSKDVHKQLVRNVINVRGMRCDCILTHLKPCSYRRYHRI